MHGSARRTLNRRATSSRIDSANEEERSDAAAMSRYAKRVTISGHLEPTGDHR